MERFIYFLLVSTLLVGSNDSLKIGDSCQTPNGRTGTCVSIENCAYAIRKFEHSTNISKNDVKYLESLRYGEICCPKFGNSATCGAPKMALRIYRGEETQRGEHPWAALLIYGFGRNQTAPLCGGTLVSERYVITAAHCATEQKNRKLLNVRFNEFNTNSKSNCTTDGDENICRYDYEVESVTSHPEYITGGLANHQHDIAFLKLAKDVSFNDYVRPICLPVEMEIQKLPIVKEYFTLTGWGETESESLSTVQLHVELPGLNIDACNSAYQPSGITVTDNQLCVGGLNGSDSCRGDAGGPLMRQFRGVWYLVGVVSFGAWKCGTADVPAVYTNVVRYLDWIEKVMFVEHYW